MDDAFAPLPPGLNGSTHDYGDADSKPTWQAIMPATKPLPKIIRFRNAAPSAVWPYLDAAGALLFATCRFDKPDGAKDVLPFIFGSDGRWHWKAPPAPRPLYGLDRLAARPDAPVLIVQGEKKTAAAEARFPDHVAVCSQGGDKAIAKADWDALQNRKVVVWPDCDKSGLDAARKLAKGLSKISDGPVRLVDVPKSWPEGWDLADALPDGVTDEALHSMLALAEAPFDAGANANPADVEDCELTEDGVAKAFATKHQDQLRYCHHEGKWFHWNDKIWRRQETQLAFSWARQLGRELSEGASMKVRAIVGKASFAGAVERFAKADIALAVKSDIWDANPWLLGTPAGTVDLRTGKIYRANPDDFITKSASVAPAETEDCPVWLNFLREVTLDDAALVAFLKQWVGYSLTGDTREEALLFVCGPGGNGKSKFLGAVQGILGAYCRTAAMDTFVASKTDRHPTDLAMLRGARMVVASETEEGRAWATVRINQMTGNDMITARFMRQDFFEYQPQFKLTIIGNFMPVLKHVNDAARRRFNIVPFDFKPPTPDHALSEKLRAEWPGILRWAINGCLDWQRSGLVRPPAVQNATKAYFDDQDTKAHWLEERCVKVENANASVTALFRDWSAWMKERGEEPGTLSMFSTWMEVRHIKQRTKAGMVFLDLRLLPNASGVF